LSSTARCGILISKSNIVRTLRLCCLFLLFINASACCSNFSDVTINGNSGQTVFFKSVLYREEISTYEDRIDSTINLRRI